jgi:hypothetical protein
VSDEFVTFDDIKARASQPFQTADGVEVADEPVVIESAVLVGEVITVTIYSMTACDVSFGAQHVPYVVSVQWDERFLTISQSVAGGVPGVEHWPLPGATESDFHCVARYPISNQYGQFGYGQPCEVIFWVEVPSV